MYGRLGNESVKDATKPMLMNSTRKGLLAAQVTCGHAHSSRILTYLDAYWRMLTYAYVCSRMLIYADIC
jgi:hypothetical protein